MLSGFDPESIKEAAKAIAGKEGKKSKELEDTCRIFVFASMNHTMRYCAAVPAELSVRSHLYSLKDTYYLVVEKQRLSKKNFNKISAQAVEFSKLLAPSEEKLLYLEEHGECLIKDRAVSPLRKICSSH